jgi:apolipoprotein N-acyltransferase
MFYRAAFMNASLLRIFAMLLSVAGGVFVAAAFPPWNQDWLIWFGFTPVLAGLLLFPGKWLAALIQGALFGGTFGGLAFSWLWKGGDPVDWAWNTGSLALVGAFWGVIVSLLVQLPALSREHKIGPILPGYGFSSEAWTKSVAHLRAALITAASWTLLEWIRGFLIPEWNAVGTVLQSSLALLQISIVTGPSGLTFVVVFANFILFAAVRRLILEPGRMSWASRFEVTSTVGVIFLAGLSGFWWLLQKPPGGRKNIVLICPNTVDFNRYLELTKQENGNETDLFVWRCVRFDPGDYGRIGEASIGKTASLVSGSTSSGKGSLNGATIVTPGTVRNLILIPRKNAFFQPGAGPSARTLNPFAFADATWVTFVNWEAADPRVVRAAAARQTQAVVALTDPFPGRGGTEQFFENLRLWMVSFGRPMIFATQKKFAAIVAPSGNVLAGGRTGGEVFRGQIILPGPLDTTPYGRYGDWFAVACGAVCLVTGISERLRRYSVRSTR